MHISSIFCLPFSFVGTVAFAVGAGAHGGLPCVNFVALLVVTICRSLICSQIVLFCGGCDVCWLLFELDAAEVNFWLFGPFLF